VASAPYISTVSEREPAVLRDEPVDEVGDADKTLKTERTDLTPAGGVTGPVVTSGAGQSSATDVTPPPAAAAATAAAPALQRPSSRRDPAANVWVVGFWKRLAAAVIDLALVVPAALLTTLIVGQIAGVHLPARNMRVLDIDMWIDLVLATDPAVVMGFVLFLAIGMVYLLVFHIALGRTLGMRVLRMKVIDVYGDPPSPARCIARCAGYLVGVATLFLGFLWIGFDSEKRGLQDWIAGTYVIKVV
jgi:uncharacterized RDD family membrane protein YckC